MRSASTCTLLFLLTFISTMEAQSFAIISDAKSDKHHQTAVDYDKKAEWKEIDGLGVKQSDKNRLKTVILKYDQEFLKIKQYQEKLLALGYNVKVTGTADDKTIKARHRDQTKNERHANMA